MMTTATSEPEIQAADPRFRRLLAVLLPALLLVGLGSLYWLRRSLLDFEYAALTSPSDAAEGILQLSSRFFVGLAAFLLLVGSWYAVVAWKTLRAERFPPEGVPVARDTAVRRGTAARLRGFVGLLLAILLLIVALALPTLGPQILHDVFLPAFEQSE